MLLKLLKYDFRAMWKQFSLVWGAALALTLVNRFTMFRAPNNELYARSDMLMFAVIAVLMAMFVIGVIFVINRFSKGLLGSEGYLMHTLPVRSWQLVASKLICGVVTWVACSGVSFLAALLMLPTEYNTFFMFPFWRDVFEAFAEHLDVVALMAEFLLMALSAMIQFIAVIYLSLSIGHLVPRHRKLAGVAAFIGLYILVMNVYGRVFSSQVVIDLSQAAFSSAYGSMLFATAAMLVPAGLCLACVCWILEHKLNLE